MRSAHLTPARPGSVMSIVAILAVFLVGMAAFAIDTGYVAGTRTRLQRATPSTDLNTTVTYGIYSPPD